MMKIKKSFLGLAAMLGLTSCSTTPTAQPSDGSSNDMANGAEGNDVVQAGLPALGNAWVMRVMERKNADIVAKYDQAFALIQAVEPKATQLQSYCWRSGDWYIVSVKLEAEPTDQRLVATDDGYHSPRLSAVYLLDMANERIVAREDWQAIAPLFNALMKRKPLSDRDDEHDFIRESVLAINLVATGTDNYLSPTSGQRLPKEVDHPKIVVKNGVLTATWYVNGTGMARRIDRHVVTWDGKQASYEHGSISFDQGEKVWD